MRWLVIGGGMAGLTAARTLADAGFDVTVFEKSRGLGGRLSTRRTDEANFDHGAQYVTARGAPFRALMTGLSNQGAVADWQPSGKDGEERWHVGAPGMRDMVAPLARDLQIELNTEVKAIEREGERFSVSVTTKGAEGRHDFDRIIVTAPAPQAERLLMPLDPSFEALEAVSMAPCWAGLFVFDGTEQLTRDIAREPNDMLGWIARNGSKPHRSGMSVVVHATPEWSRANLERDRAMVAEDLLAAFRQVSGFRARSLYKSAHRWRYAFVEKPLERAFLASKDATLFACGDWCIAPRAEAAFESARQLCEHIKTR